MVGISKIHTRVPCRGCFNTFPGWFAQRVKLIIGTSANICLMWFSMTLPFISCYKELKCNDHVAKMNTSNVKSLQIQKNSDSVWLSLHT